jgi:hypothetical protein
VDVVDTGCAASSTAQAYVFNASVVPYGALGYLTLWWDGAHQPLVSTLNALDGSISSNHGNRAQHQRLGRCLCVGNHAVDPGHLQLLRAVRWRTKFSRLIRRDMATWLGRGGSMRYTCSGVGDRAESFGPVEPSHFIFAAFVPKFTFSGKKVIGYNVTAFDPTTHVKSWRSAWRTLTKKAGLPGFRFHDLRHCAITQLAEGGTSDSTIMAIAGHVSRRMLERYSHVRMEAKRNAMEALATSTKTAGYDTNHDTNVMPASTRPV